jgi:hypothetical protein
MIAAHDNSAVKQAGRTTATDPLRDLWLRFGKGDYDHCLPSFPDDCPGLACDHPYAGHTRHAGTTAWSGEEEGPPLPWGS